MTFGGIFKKCWKQAFYACFQRVAIVAGVDKSGHSATRNDRKSGTTGNIGNKIFAVLVLFFALVPALHAQSAVHLSFHLKNGHIDIPCSVNGAAPTDCLVDTGANASAIDSGVPHVALASQNVAGVGDNAMQAQTVSLSVKVDGVEKAVSMVGVAVPGLQNANHVSVILGVDWLEHWRTVQIDWKTETLTLSN